MSLFGHPLQVPLDVAHAELDMVVGVLVATQASPVPVDEVRGHSEERCGFLERDRPVRAGSGMGTGAGDRQQASEALEQIGQLGFRICRCSGLFGSHT